MTRELIDGTWADDYEEEDEGWQPSPPAGAQEANQGADSWTCVACGKPLIFIGYSRYLQPIYIERSYAEHPDHGAVSWWCSLKGEENGQENIDRVAGDPTAQN